MESTNIVYDIADAIMDKDIVLTDSLSKEQLQDFNDYQITCELMDKANDNALLNPCPPFFRGEEVADDVLSSKYFVGYDFKKSLLEVQQAIIVFTMTNQGGNFLQKTFSEIKLFQVKPEKLELFEAIAYCSFWEFDSKENYGKATKWFFETYLKDIQKLLIAPFDINCGNSL